MLGWIDEMESLCVKKGKYSRYVYNNLLIGVALELREQLVTLSPCLLDDFSAGILMRLVQRGDLVEDDMLV